MHKQPWKQMATKSVFFFVVAFVVEIWISLEKSFFSYGW
jgi:hypothetical protein